MNKIRGGILITLLSLTALAGCECDCSDQDSEYWLQYHEPDGYWEYSAGALGTKAECENHLLRYGKPGGKYVKVTCARRPKDTKGVFNE